VCTVYLLRCSRSKTRSIVKLTWRRETITGTKTVTYIYSVYTSSRLHPPNLCHTLTEDGQTTEYISRFREFLFRCLFFLTKAAIFNLPVNNINTQELGKNTEEVAVATRLLIYIWYADGSNTCCVARSRAWTSFVIFASLPRQISRYYLETDYLYRH